MSKGLKTGDKVKVLSGDHKGEIAEIVKIDRTNGKAMLKDINIVERHVRKSYYNPQGGKNSVHVGIDVSNLKKEGK